MTEMRRVDFARWMLVFVLCCTVVATMAGSAIGVLLGTTYIVIAITATLVDIIEKGGTNGGKDHAEKVHKA